MSGRWGAFCIHKTRKWRRRSFSCVPGYEARAALVCLTNLLSFDSTENNYEEEVSQRTDIHCCHGSNALSERLSLVDFGAAGNSISNLGSWHGASLFGGEKSFWKLQPFPIVDPLPHAQHWGYTCTESSPPFQGSRLRTHFWWRWDGMGCPLVVRRGEALVGGTCPFEVTGSVRLLEEQGQRTFFFFF